MGLVFSALNKRAATGKFLSHVALETMRDAGSLRLCVLLQLPRTDARKPKDLSAGDKARIEASESIRDGEKVIDLARSSMFARPAPPGTWWVLAGVHSLNVDALESFKGVGFVGNIIGGSGNTEARWPGLLAHPLLHVVWAIDPESFYYVWVDENQLLNWRRPLNGGGHPAIDALGVPTDLAADPDVRKQRVGLLLSRNAMRLLLSTNVVADLKSKMGDAVPVTVLGETYSTWPDVPAAARTSARASLVELVREGHALLAAFDRHLPAAPPPGWHGAAGDADGEGDEDPETVEDEDKPERNKPYRPKWVRAGTGPAGHAPATFACTHAPLRTHYQRVARGTWHMTAWNVLSCGMSLVHISKNTLLDFLHEAGSPRAAQGSWVKHMEGL